MGEVPSQIAHEPPAAESVAVIGLGAMGAQIASRLLSEGYHLVIWNRTPTASASLAQAGAMLARNPAEAAAQASTVLITVADPAALHAVTEGAAGVASGICTGAQVIVMATVGPAAIGRLAAVISSHCDLLDAPVLGSLTEARSGALSIFVGGNESSIQRATAVLATLGTVFHVGPLGAGNVAKLIANATLFGVVALLGEALALGQALGLPRDVVYTLLSATPLAQQLQRRRPSLESNEFPPRFRLALARKDGELLSALASSAGLDARLMRAANAWFADAEAHRLGEQDYTAVLSYILSAAQTGLGSGQPCIP
jgi:3-hydroxyisobutyrate dehydrogenase-like beta-hydroxyacid dehydrogenase